MLFKEIHGMEKVDGEVQEEERVCGYQRPVAIAISSTR